MNYRRRDDYGRLERMFTPRARHPEQASVREHYDDMRHQLELLPVKTYSELAPWMQEAVARALRAMKTEDA